MSDPEYDAWLLRQAEKASKVHEEQQKPSFDMLREFVKPNNLDVEDEVHAQLPWTFFNYKTRSDEPNEPDQVPCGMHVTGQMRTTDHVSYSVENSFYVRKIHVGPEDSPHKWTWEWRLVGVKVLCKSREYNGATVWEPFSYLNRRLPSESEQEERLWIKYPTSDDTVRVINFEKDTCVDHRGAVEATMRNNDIVDFKIFLHGSNPRRCVLAKAKVVDAWCMLDDGNGRCAPAYQIELVKQ